MVEFIYRFHKSEVALLDKVEEVHTSADVLFRNAYNQSEVCFDKLVLCVLVAESYSFSEISFTFGVKKRDFAYILKVHSDGVVYRNAFFSEEFVDILIILDLFLGISYNVKAIVFASVVIVVVLDIVGYLNSAAFECLIHLVNLVNIVTGVFKRLHNIVV